MKEQKISNDRYIVKIKRKYIILNTAGLFLLKLIETKSAKDIVKLICEKYYINEVEAKEQIHNFNRMLADENNFIDTELLNLKRPLNIQWKITNKCNLNCLHCYNRNEVVESIDENSRDHIFNEILKAKPLSVLFTGGEPLTCSKTIEYMKKAFDTGIEVRLFTNGTLISNHIKTLAYMKDNLIVNISIDGDEKTHELIRGVNSYNLVRENILKLVNEEISISVNMVVNKLNFKSFIDVVKDLYSIGVKSIQFSHLTLSGNALKNHTKLVMTDSDYLEFDNDINKILIPFIKENENIELYYKPFSEKFTNEYTLVLKNRNLDTYSDTWECCAGRTRITIDPVGNVFPCAFLKDKYNMGNVLNKNICSIWKSDQKIGFLNELSKNGNFRCIVFDNSSNNVMDIPNVN